MMHIAFFVNQLSIGSDAKNDLTEGILLLIVVVLSISKIPVFSE
jgi:hypothetical protein